MAKQHLERIKNVEIRNANSYGEGDLYFTLQNGEEGCTTAGAAKILLSNEYFTIVAFWDNDHKYYASFDVYYVLSATITKRMDIQHWGTCTYHEGDDINAKAKDIISKIIAKYSDSATKDKNTPSSKKLDDSNKAFALTIFGLIVAEGFIACIPGGLIRNVASDNVVVGVVGVVWLTLAVLTFIFRKAIYIVAKFLALFILFVGGFGIFAWGQFEKGSVGIGILLAVLAVLFGVLIVIKGIKAFKER